MNRRQFLACSLSGAVASAALPWDPFVEWCAKWLGFVRKKATATLESFSELMKRVYGDAGIEALVYGESPFLAMLERA